MLISDIYSLISEQTLECSVAERGSESVTSEAGQAQIVVI